MDGVMLGSGSWERTDKLPEFISVGEPELVKLHQITRAKTMAFLELSLQMSCFVS